MIMCNEQAKIALKRGNGDESIVKHCNIMSVIQYLYVAGIIRQAARGMHKT